MKKLSLFLRYLGSRKQRKDFIYNQYLSAGRVLDLGCGAGEMIRFDPQRFTGIDANEFLVQKLQDDDLDVILGNVTQLPFADASFDAVHCSNVIEHLNPEEAYLMLKETARVLKSGGRMIIITPTPRTVWRTFGHIKPYPPEAIKKIFREISLEKRDSITTLQLSEYFFLGCLSGRLLFLLSSFLANTVGWLAGLSYMIIVKNKNTE